MMEDAEILREFLLESAENLERLDQNMVELEQRPKDADLLASIFRTIHTIKGTCGFFGFTRLEAIAHIAENLLNELRNGTRQLDTALASLLLNAVDAIKRILKSISETGGEGEVFEQDLLQQLETAWKRPAANATAAVATESKPAPPASQPTTPEPALVPNVAAVQAAPASDSAAASGQGEPPSTLRVDVGLLDRLMNLVGELVLTRNQVLQFTALQDDAAFSGIAHRLNLITGELQERVMKTRMQPLGRIFNQFPRVVRDLATAMHKQIALDVEGAETELDRTLVEAIKDPLTHIVRNSCDHGIETPEERVRKGKPAMGRLMLRAFHEGGQVNIEIADDGAGIDLARVRAKAVERGLMTAEKAARLSDRETTELVFLPGFSTAQAVTKVSGRGVGMDVVRTKIEAIGGTVDLSSQPGRGTTLLIRIPLTLAIVPGLLVNAGGERFVIPQIGLHELIRLEGEAAHSAIEHLHQAPVFRRRNALLPVADLCQVLNLPARRSADELSIVVVQVDGRRFGLIVDAINDTEEIVVKPLWQQLKCLNCYAGATIMGDGGIALILDVAGIGLRAGVIGGQQTGTAESTGTGTVADVRRSLLLLRAGSLQRLAMPLARVARLENIAASDVESAGGRSVVQYRGHVLPLASLAQLLDGSPPPQTEVLQAVVYRHGEVDIGLVVDEIVDIVEESVGSPFPTDRAGLLGSAVVGGQVTDFLDLDTVAQWALPSGGSSLARLEAALFEDQRTPRREMELAQ
jgi:two-component system, chemotaxis family, sensor kinase CheA